MSFTFFPLLLLNSLIFEGVVPLSNYNGFLYEKFIDPLIAGIHSYISKKVPIGSTCVDACCGTGQLALKLASRCKEVTGVDLSPSMIRTALKKKEHFHISNVTFIHGDVIEVLKGYENDHFDYATISMAFHEMPKIFRVPVLIQMSRVSKRVIAVDYVPKMPWNLSGIRNRLLEFIAGAEHFSNFREFRQDEGLQRLAAEAELAIEEVKFLDKENLMVLFMRKSQQLDLHRHSNEHY